MGLPAFWRLSRSYASNRNWKVKRSRIFRLLMTARSRLATRGPVKIFRPALPPTNEALPTRKVVPGFTSRGTWTKCAVAGLIGLPEESRYRSEERRVGRGGVGGGWG